MKCYKIVRKYGGEHYSSCRMYGNSYVKSYCINEWTIADSDTIGICWYLHL